MSQRHQLACTAEMPSALQFYEEAWAGKLELMDELMAEDHAQRDMVWQVQSLLHQPSSALFLVATLCRSSYKIASFRVWSPPYVWSATGYHLFMPGSHILRHLWLLVLPAAL